MAIVEIYKDPDSELDYGFTWAEWLVAGDTISDSQWVVPAGLTLEDQSFGADYALVWLSGGTLGETYIVTNRIVTVGGRKEDQSILVIMKDK